MVTKSTIENRIEEFLSYHTNYKSIKLIKSSFFEKIKHLYESFTYRIQHKKSFFKMNGGLYELIDLNFDKKLGYVKITEWDCKEGVSYKEKASGIIIKIKINSSVNINGKNYEGLLLSYCRIDTASPGYYFDSKIKQKIDNHYLECDYLNSKKINFFN